MKKTTKQSSRNFVSSLNVAELAGVSRSAVSRTFTDGASVSDETRRKVLQAAEQLGYHVNHLARGLMHDRSNIVSLVVSDVRGPYQSSLIDEIIRVLQASNRVAMVINTEGDDDGAKQALAQSLSYRAEATVLLSGRPSASLIETCIAHGQHVILVNRDEKLVGADRITIDNSEAAAEAVKLLQHAGRKRHAVISTTNQTPSLIARERAYLSEAKAAGLDVEVISTGPTSYASGAEAARRIFGRAEAPDAAFCVTDIIALGLMDTAREEFGLKIPNDLCVIGFDDIEQAQWASYQLTTFRQPLAEIARQIGLLLDEQSENALGRDISLTTTPIWRKTVMSR